MRVDDGVVYVFEAHIESDPIYKVGLTCDICKRLVSVEKERNNEVKLAYNTDYMDYQDAASLELAVHRRLHEFRVFGMGREWYKTDLDTIIEAIKLSSGSPNRDYPILRLPPTELTFRSISPQKRDYSNFINVEFTTRGIVLRR